MEPKKSNWYESQVFWLISGGILFIALVGFGVWRYLNVTGELNKLKTDSGQISADDQKKLLDEVGKLIFLPKDETPTIALVTDVSQLKGQAFFENAQNGDRVLIYPQAKKAILYRPANKLIIDVAPVNLDATQSSAQNNVQGANTDSASNNPQISGTVELRNGTAIQGLTQSYEAELKRLEPNLTVNARGNALKTDYQKSMIINAAGNRLEEAQSLSATLGMPVATLPEGENSSTADFLIILGSDRGL